MCLVETHDVLPLTRRDTQVYVFIADGSIGVIDDEPVAKSVKHDLVKILRLNLPVADHTRSKTIPLSLRNV